MIGVFLVTLNNTYYTLTKLSLMFTHREKNILNNPLNSFY